MNLCAFSSIVQKQQHATLSFSKWGNGGDTSPTTAFSGCGLGKYTCVFRKPSSQYTAFFEQVLIYFKCPSGITNQQSKLVASSPPISAWAGTKEEKKIGRAEEKCHYSSHTHPPTLTLSRKSTIETFTENVL